MIAFTARGLVQRAVVAAVFLAASLGFDTRVNTSRESLTASGWDEPEYQQQSEPARESTKQAGYGAIPTDGAKIELADGTPVRLRFLRPVMSSRVIAGDKVRLEVVAAVLAGNVIAIPQHSSAEALVIMAQAGRSMGRGGNMQLKIESVRLADGEVAPVRAVKDVKGSGAREPVILLGATAGIAYWAASPLEFLFYVKGKSAAIPAGTEITAYISGNLLLDPSKFQTVAGSEGDVPK
jgi:hypothetical protein